MKKYGNENTVSFKGVPVGEPFYENGDFKMYGFNVSDTEYPNIHHSKYGSVSVVGELPRLSIGTMYNVTGIEKYNSQYGYSYSVTNIQAEKPTDIFETQRFLEEILTYNQVSEITREYPNFIDMIMNGKEKEIDVSKLKGIGETALQKIITKINENFKYSELLTEFDGLFSLATIKKLYETYTSTEMVKKKLQEDPYKFLTNIDKIGFKRADQIILKYERDGKLLGAEPFKTSKQRCKAFITYALNDNLNNGNTCMDLLKLQKQCVNEVKDCAKYFVDCIKEDDIWYDRNRKIVAFKSVYDKEKYCADKIVSALRTSNKNNFDVSKYKKCGDIELTDEQLQSLQNLSDYNISMLIGSAGCVDSDTEFFTGEGWKKISDYQDGDYVLQWNEDGTAELVLPERYIKLPEKYLYHFDTKYGIDQTLSLEHNVIWRSPKGKVYKTKFSDIYEQYLNDYMNLKKMHFITTFKYIPREDSVIKLTDDEIRLCIAIFADGHFRKESYDKDSNLYKIVRFNLKKERKIIRLRELLNKIGIEYREVKLKGGESDYINFYFKAPLLTKNFPKEWYNCSEKQKQIIIDEINFWDGYYKKNNCFTTTKKDDADFIQFVYSSMGQRATINLDNRVGQKYKTNNKEYVRKSIAYEVLHTNRIYPGLHADKRRPDNHTKIEKVRTTDGYKYCFTVPSGALVLRRNNKIFITGNSGKSQTTEAIIKMLEDNKKSYILLAPTGKASKVLSEYTGRKASTIHRGLAYSPMSGWGFNHDNPLPVDYVIMDEGSMADIFLFYRLLDAIDFERTKLLIIGDAAQLSSVSAGNCLHDLLDSDFVPVAELTKIFRYSDGGLMTVATDCRNCKPYLNNCEKTVTTFGLRHDYNYVRCSDSNIIKFTLGLYQKLLHEGIEVDDIMVTSAYNIGDYGVITLNNQLQKIANKNYGSDDCFKVGKTVYYIGDIVMQTTNNYNSRSYDLEKCEIDQDSKIAIYNGESGRVVKILKWGIVIKFDAGCVIYNNKELQTCQLGYACTTHKSQGDSRDYVIIVSPQAHTYMLTSNLLYVALTRTKKRCYQLGSDKVINRAVKKKDEEKRNTMLTFLINEREC